MFKLRNIKKYVQIALDYSIINALAKSCWSWTNPIVFLVVHVFAFPLNFHSICWRCGSDLNNLLLIWSIISKLSITTKTIFTLFFLSIFFLSSYFYKTVELYMTWAVAHRAWYWHSLFMPILWFFLMFSYPKFMVCFIHF